MPKTQPKDNVNKPEPVKPGKLLREAREAKRFTQQEVAGQMKLHLRIITSIDNDQFENMPSSGYVRGYLRSYALLVGCDPQTVLDSYNAMAVDSPPLQPYASQPAQQAHSGDLLVRVVTWLIVLVLIGLLLMWWKNQEDVPDSLNQLLGQPESPAVSQPAVTTEAQPDPATTNSLDYKYPIIVHSEPEVTVASEIEAMAVAPVEQIAATPNPAEATDSGQQNAEPSAPVATPDSASETAAAEPEGQARLYVSSPNESWIEILDSTGKKLFFNLAAAGREIDVTGVPPFKVLVGNSQGVVVRYNQADQDIKAFSNEGVSRFSINQDGPFRPAPQPEQPSE